jgi:tetratricopeptide (TPR) repeat protein
MDALVFYLRQLFWPTTLLPDYGRQPTFDLVHAVALLVAGGLLLGLALVTAKKTRAVLALTPLLIFAVGLGPHLGFFPSLYQSVSTVADRYTYLALIGPAFGIALVWTLALDGKRKPWQGCLLAASALWLGMLLSKTTNQIPLWKTTESLFSYNTVQYPASFTAPHALGDLAMVRGDAKKAAEYYRQSIQVRPHFAQGYASLGHALLDDKNPQAAKLALTQAVALNNQNPSALLNLGVSLQRTGDVAAAKEKYLAVNGLSPHPLAYYNLGSIYLQAGELDQAESAFLNALRLNPRLHQAHSQLGLLYDRRGQTEERDRHLHAAAALGKKL